MKTMKIEKKLLFDDKISAITTLTAEEKLDYKQESDGSVRAIGPLFIRGELLCEDGRKQPFQEVLDMDVLAPAYKLGSDPFQLSVERVDYQLEDDGIALHLIVGIEGLLEQPAQPLMEEKIMEEEDTRYENEDAVGSKKIEDHEEQETIETQEGSAVDEFEDLFEDADTTYTSYRMVVAALNDTYSSIAQRYDVDEEALRSVNRNKEIQPKTLIVLPF